MCVFTVWICEYFCEHFQSVVLTQSHGLPHLWSRRVHLKGVYKNENNVSYNNEALLCNAGCSAISETIPMAHTCNP